MSFDQSLDQALEHWRRYSLSGKHEPVKCISIESRYRSPQTWHATEPTRNIDVLLAEKVEKAVVINPHRDLIVYSVLKPKTSLFKVCRMAGIKPYQFTDTLNKARQMLAIRLRITA